MLTKVIDIKNVVGNDLKSFIFNNNILGTMSAVTIAFSTGTMIRSLVGDLILPSFYSIFNSGTAGFTGLSSDNVSKFIKEFVSWLIVILITFIFIDYILKKFIWKQEQSSNDQYKKNTESVSKKENISKKEDSKNISIEEFYNPHYSIF